MALPPLLRETGATYVGGQFGFSTSGTISGMGAAAGDLLILFDLAGSTTSLSSGNALVSIGSGFKTRVLNSSDVAGTVGGTAGNYSVVIYRSAASAAVVDTDTSAGAASSKDAGGFTKNASHAGIACFIVSTTAGATCSVASPLTFATRGNFNPGGGYGTEFVCDRLQPGSPYYISGTSLIWNSSGSGNQFYVLELRS